MKHLSWFKHAVILATAYFIFSTLAVWSVILYYQQDILAMMKNASNETLLWLRSESDEEYQLKFERLARLREKGPTLVGNVWLVDEKGTVITTTSTLSLPDFWNAYPLPEELFKLYIHDAKLFSKTSHVITRVKKEPPRFLVASELAHLEEEGVFPTVTASLKKMVRTYMLFYIVSVAFLSTFTVFYVFRQKAREAKKVMSSIESGNFKSRFEVNRADEIGGLMANFNRMADTVEHLFSKLRQSEQTRRSLLQELNHDLRTPLSTLQLIVETLNEHQRQLPAKRVSELLRDASKELAYTTRLLQFLFSISEMDEASYRVDFKKEDLVQILQHEIEGKDYESRGGAKLDVELLTHGLSECAVQADLSLLTRLVRNSVDNASRFAVSKIRLALTDSETVWRLEVFDDGPGPNEESLERFGKRPVRPVGLDLLKPHVSTGLGSSIMLAVVQLHGGHLTLKRAQHPWGAVLVIELPKEQGVSESQAV